MKGKFKVHKTPKVRKQMAKHLANKKRRKW